MNREKESACASLVTNYLSEVMRVRARAHSCRVCSDGLVCLHVFRE